MMREDAPVMSKIVAWLGGGALGVVALLDAVIGMAMLIGGHMIGAMGEVGEQLGDQHLAEDGNHHALVAKLLAAGFLALAGGAYLAGHLLRHRKRSVIVPAMCVLTTGAWVALAISSHSVNALHAVVVACAAFAGWVWWKLPRTAVAGSAPSPATW